MWQKALAAVAVGLMLASPLSGCGAGPQRQPEATNMSTAERSAAVAQVAARDSGAGETAAVVFDNKALIAIQLNAATPGGTDGQALIGTVTEPDERKLTEPGGGPPASGHGPGGSTGTPVAMPGGGLHPGGASAGGSPVRTQAAPNASGGQATDAGTNAPVSSPGSQGYAPLDVMHRIANQVRSRYPEITEVRFAYIPADALRLREIARAVEGGAAVSAHQAELASLYERAAPAGATEFHPMHPAPANNSQGAPGTAPTPVNPR